MKRLVWLIPACCLVAFGLVLQAFRQSRADMQASPRIAIAGIAIESSTFSPARTEEAAFYTKYGADAFSSYPFLSPDSPLRQQAIWIPTVVGRALPGGVVTRKAYESIVSKTIDSLNAHKPFDGVYLDIHGAMSVEGLDDPEGDYLQRVRKAVGNSTIISTSMDLHGNVSWRLAKNTDLITCYRKAPHEDALETKERAVTQLISRIKSGKGKPAFKAYVNVPVLLPGEKTSTRMEPAKSLYAAVSPAARQNGITDISVWVGYAWADEPRNHAAVMVTGDDKEKTLQIAEQMARRFWDARADFSFVAPAGTLNECLAKALISKQQPYFISDCGDNPTAGAPGDVTWTLKQLLARKEFADTKGRSVIYASIPGPDLVKKAEAVGVGFRVSGNVGAEVDHRFSGPVRLSGIVRAIVKGDKDAETEVVVQAGSVNVIVTKKRKAYRTRKDFTMLKLEPLQTDIVIVKLGYLDPELYAMKAGWMLALTPGGVDQNIEGLNFKRIQRPMFPFDKNLRTPDLRAKLVPLSHE